MKRGSGRILTTHAGSLPRPPRIREEVTASERQRTPPRVEAGAYSVEASNPRHDHEWRVWERVALPEGRLLIPGVVGHASDFIEHPRLVADRLVRYARLVGRERVLAGTDCGLGHEEIAWAKLEALVEGGPARVG